ERAVAFVSLHHHPLAFAHTRIGAVSVDDAAIDHGRVFVAGVEQRSNHRRRRGFAVRAPDRDRPFQPHDLREHLRAPHDRHPARPTIGPPRARASSTSGLPSLIADEITTTPALAEFSALWPIKIVMPCARRRSVLALSFASEPVTS